LQNIIHHMITMPRIVSLISNDLQKIDPGVKRGGC